MLRPMHDKYILNLDPGARVLDLACGTGAFLEKVIAYRDDLNLYGCDIVDGIPERLVSKFSLKVRDIDRHPHPKKIQDKLKKYLCQN